MGNASTGLLVVCAGEGVSRLQFCENECPWTSGGGLRGQDTYANAPQTPVKNSGFQKGQNDLFDQKGQNDDLDPRNP